MLLNLVVTVIENKGDDTFGDIIGVYEDFNRAIEIRDTLNNGGEIEGLDTSMLALFDSVQVITRTLNENFKNVEVDA